jgi:pimeloyl-ACP methyl ester carboxylesterase
MLPVADPDMTARAVQDFLAVPIDWFFHMALRTHQHQRVSLSGIKVPAVFIAAKYDLLVASKDMMTAAERLAESTYVELPGSRFIQMEKPGIVQDELMDFLERLT